MQAMENEMQSTGQPKKLIQILVNRADAIDWAIEQAQANDVILIAGKGHETYQEINGVRHDFDDLQIVTELLKQLNK